jgi:hypothetical protein
MQSERAQAEPVKAVVAEGITKQSFFERIGVTPAEFCKVVDANPSIRGVIIGYVGERKLREFFASDGRVSGLTKDDDHDRTKKGDLNVVYKGRTFRFESKSLQTNSIKRPPKSDPFQATATYQCDASDCRTIQLRNKHKVRTTCLEVGEFDIVAVNLFALEDKWRFAFALNYDLPRTNCKKYSKKDQAIRLATLPKITWPVQWPYVLDPFPLMDLLIAGQESLPKPAGSVSPLS